MQNTVYKFFLAPFLAGLFFSCAFLDAEREGPGGDNNLLSAAIHIYQGPLNHLSAVRRGTCPMYPSDSEYGKQSIQKHGMVIGWIMAADRLMRCGRDEIRLCPKIFIDGQWRCYDPVEINDFWWRIKEKTSSGD